jgi:hypothetical protein
MKRFVRSTLQLSAACLFTLPLVSHSVEPATWAAIAEGAVKVYNTTAEGQCVAMARQCVKKNVEGTAARCHEVRRRIGEFLKTPNTAITGSSRTQCLAKKIMGDQAWADFQGAK